MLQVKGLHNLNGLCRKLLNSLHNQTEIFLSVQKSIKTNVYFEEEKDIYDADCHDGDDSVLEIGMHSFDQSDNGGIIRYRQYYGYQKNKPKNAGISVLYFGP